MSKIIKCIFQYECCTVSSFFWDLLDIISPIILEIIIISILFNAIINYKEKLKWKPVVSALYTRLIKFQDDILMELIPITYRSSDIKIIKIDNLETETLFNWKEKNNNIETIAADFLKLKDYETEIFKKKIISYKNLIKSIFKSEVIYLSPKIIKSIIEIENSINSFEIIINLKDISRESFIGSYKNLILCINSLREILRDVNNITNL